MDRKLEGAALRAHLAWAQSLPSSAVLATGKGKPYAIQADDNLAALSDSAIVLAGSYCRYMVIGAQGSDCSGFLSPTGGILCVRCTGTFPAGGGNCPSWAGSQWNHYDANGNVVCTGTIFSDHSTACEECFTWNKAVDVLE